MCEVDQFRERGAKGRDIGRGVEQWWILFDEQVLHLPAAILGCLVFGRSMLRCLNLRLVDELLLCASARVNDGWQTGLWAMWHVEGKGLDVTAYPR